ncbi:MAG: hypothetical protein WAM11_12020 [Cyanobium sp.]
MGGIDIDAGVRDGEERQRLDTCIGAFTALPLDRQTAQRVGLWRRASTAPATAPAWRLR